MGQGKWKGRNLTVRLAADPEWRISPTSVGGTNMALYRSVSVANPAIVAFRAKAATEEKKNMAKMVARRVSLSGPCAAIHAAGFGNGRLP